MEAGEIQAPKAVAAIFHVPLEAFEEFEFRQGRLGPLVGDSRHKCWEFHWLSRTGPISRPFRRHNICARRQSCSLKERGKQHELIDGFISS